MSESGSVPRIHLKPGADRRARRGYPWAYSNEIEMTAEAKAIAPGSVVNFVSHDGRGLGAGYFNPHSLICGRILASDADTVTSDFYAAKLHAALALRQRLYPEPYYRLAHAEADGLPGLVIDRFGKAVVVQINAAGPERHADMIVEAIDATIRPEAIVLRRDGSTRPLEGLTVEDATIAKGALEGPITLTENGYTYFADLLSGQKTGWFYDHRDNRAFVARLGAGMTVLDVYSHTGGFAIAAAVSGAASVLGLDRSEPALDLARRAARANGVEASCRFEKREAFEALESLGRTGERFGIVIADPPAFVKSPISAYAQPR